MKSGKGCEVSFMGHRLEIVTAVADQNACPQRSENVVAVCYGQAHCVYHRNCE